MKHPALTRVFAVVLVLMCMTMALAGGLGLSRAERDRQTANEEMTRLRARVDEYRAVTASLSGSDSYADQSEALDERQAQHDREASEQRIDLTTYTATQYGLQLGIQALDEADWQFASLKSVFDRGMIAFQQGMGQASQLLSQLWQVYNAAAGILENVNAHMVYAMNLDASLAAGEELTVATLVSAYDEVLRAVDETEAAIATIYELEPTLDALAAFDPASLSSLADGMGDIPAGLSGLGDFQLPSDLTAVTQVPIDLTQFSQMRDQFNEIWAVIKQALADFAQIRPQLDAQIQSLTGMSTAELRAAAQANRDALAAQGEEPLDAELSEAIYAAYTGNYETIQAMIGRANAEIGQINGYAAQAYSLLYTLQTQLDALNALMAQAQQMIAAGERALYDARTMIWWQMGQQSELEESLRGRRTRLDQESEELRGLSEQAEDQRSLEQSQRSLRAILLERDEIRSRMDAGQELPDAALSYAEDTEREAELTWTLRRRACLLMLAGAVCGLLGLPAAFEQIRSRFLLLTPVLLCLAGAIGAEWIFVGMGRGHSYSALTVAGFALLQLLVTVPVDKKKRGGKHLAA